MWEIGRFKLFLHRGINNMHKFSCVDNAVHGYNHAQNLRKLATNKSIFLFSVHI